MISEQDILKRLREGKVTLPPLSFILEKESPCIGGRRMDAVIDARLDGRSVGKFVVECKALSTPMAVQSALDAVRSLDPETGLYPMVIIPFLSEARLAEFEDLKISAVDLCGNGVVSIAPTLRIFRTGNKNQFSSTAPIKNVYRKNSSLVARMLLSKPRFGSLQELHQEVNTCNPMVQLWRQTPMGLSTVSKVLKALEEDLLIERKGKSIQLIQPEKLLDKLARNYAPPSIRERIRMKIFNTGPSPAEQIDQIAKIQDMPYRVTGLSSVGRYAVMQRGEILFIYCPQRNRITQYLQGEETDRFPNIELLETDDERAYFGDSRDDKIAWASPIQTYLELMDGDKRDRETADQVRAYILGKLKRQAE